MLAAGWMAFKAFGLWGRIGAALQAGAQWASGHPVAAMLVLSMIGNVGQLVVHRHDLAAHRADLAKIAGIERAQVAARAAQITVNQAPAIASAALARQSDAQAPAYYDAVRSAVAAHDVFVRGAADPAGGSYLPGAHPPAAIDDGPAATAGMVCRAKADDDLFIAASGRAAKMHQDALDLIARGIAVPDDVPDPAPVASGTPQPGTAP